MSSRGSRVDVMETSKDWPGDDQSGGAERTRSRRMQIQTPVGAIAVVVSGELPEQEVSTTSTRGQPEIRMAYCPPSVSTICSSGASSTSDQCWSSLSPTTNQDRLHRALGLETPVPSSRRLSEEIRSRPVLGGLHHVYERAA